MDLEIFTKVLKDFQLLKIIITKYMNSSSYKKLLKYYKNSTTKDLKDFKSPLFQLSFTIYTHKPGGCT